MSDYERTVIAGLLSTIDFTPAHEHPSAMLPMASRVLEVIAWLHSQAAVPMERSADGE